VVGKAVLSLRFDLSQALGVCLVVFQVCKRVLGVILVWWILCKTFEIVQSEAQVALTNWI